MSAALKDPLRRDLRDRFVITIDPVDARDFDDAISLERTPEGGYKLGVHIADVSHYVAWDGHIDLEARHRTTSVYLADRVLPMLPERLSCDLCSLRPDEDRLAFTVDIELDAQGRVRHYDPQKSRIPVYTLCYGAFSFQKSPGLCASGASSNLCAVPFLRYLSISSSSSSLKYTIPE